MKLLFIFIAFTVIALVRPRLLAAEKVGSQQNSAPEASELLNKGQALLDRLRDNTSGQGENDLYYEESDRVEVALGYFKRAAELDPDNAQAWFGWGRALEGRYSNYLYLRHSWLTRKYFAVLPPLRPRPCQYGPKVVKALMETAMEAEGKFKKAAELEPDNTDIFMAWNKNLFKQARHEIDWERRRSLARKGCAGFEELAGRYKENETVIRDLIIELAALIPYIEDENDWQESFARLEDLLLQYISLLTERAAVLNAGADENRPSAKRKVGGEGVRYSLLGAGREIDSKYWPRIFAFWNLLIKYCSALEFKIREHEVFSVCERYAEISLAIEKEEEWAESIRLFEGAFDLPDKSGHKSRYFNKQAFIMRAAESEMNSARKKCLAERARNMMTEELEPMSQGGITDNTVGPVRGNNPPRNFELRILRILGSGKEKEEAFEARLKSLSEYYEGEIATEIDIYQKGQIYTYWARRLLSMAFIEAPDKSEFLIEETKRLLEAVKRTKSYDGTGRYGKTLIYDLTDSFQDILDFVEREAKTPEQLKKLLDLDFDDLKEYEREAHLMESFEHRFYYECFIRVCLKLAAHPFTDSKDRSLLKSKVLQMILRLANEEHKTPDYLLIENFYDGDYRFVLAQTLIEISQEESAYLNTDDIKAALIRASNLLKWYFSDLPIFQKSILGYVPGVNTYPAAESYKNQLTPILAQQMSAIRFNLIGQGIDDAKSKVWLAGIYRYVAVSGMLLPHYRDMYLSRSEDLLRQVLDMTSAAVDDEEAERLRVYERAWAKAELGLLLSEVNMIKTSDSHSEIPEETEKIWGEADELRPGSSYYARARWAAWAGDAERIKQYLSHAYCYSDWLLFPDYEEAVYEPAFAEICDQAWFKRAWYGLEVFKR